MKTKQVVIGSPNDLNGSTGTALTELDPHIVFTFGDSTFFNDPDFAKQLKLKFGKAAVVGCSTAGEIATTGFSSGTLSITAVRFKEPQLKFASTVGHGLEDSFNLGTRIAEQMAGPNLRSIFLLLQGVNINGSEVIKGIQSKLGQSVLITGGLAGDSGQFQQTFVMLNESVLSQGAVSIGFYGDSVKVSFGSVGGWEPFGPTRKVTKAKGNMLYELDNTPALSVYKTYLGEFAKDLPGSALHFPLSVLEPGQEKSDLTRTILGVDEKDGSLTLAGDIPEGGQVRLMHAQASELVNGAREAGGLAAEDLTPEEAQNSLAILVSCVGRKLVIGDDEIEEEIEAAREALQGVPVAGFYSYGEVCPNQGVKTDCRLHNQTMTISLFRD